MHIISYKYIKAWFLNTLHSYRLITKIKISNLTWFLYDCIILYCYCTALRWGWWTFITRFAWNVQVELFSTQQIAWANRIIEPYHNWGFQRNNDSCKPFTEGCCQNNGVHHCSLKLFTETLPTYFVSGLIYVLLYYARARNICLRNGNLKRLFIWRLIMSMHLARVN